MSSNPDSTLSSAPLSAKEETAQRLFHNGANCAQSVVGAFASECGLTEAEAMRLASGFGAGMGRLREVCGTVSGMVLVANLLFGPTNASEKSEKDAHYAFIQELAGAFRAETGSIVCRELLGLAQNQSDAPISEPRTETYYKKRPCGEMVLLAVQILEKKLQEKRL